MTEAYHVNIEVTMSPPAAEDSVRPPVDRRHLEESLQWVRRHTADPAAGIHGPGTLAWEIGRENVLFLGGGCAALLQLAHPAVASAISQHSKTQVDAWGRFWRTFRNVWAMAFGDLDQAFASARRVHAIHCRVFGKLAEGAGAGPAVNYRANQPEALLWVYATLVDSSIRVFELLVRELSAEEKDAYVDESRAFGLLFGIPRDLMPGDFHNFSRYMAGQLDSGRIAAWPPARQISDLLLRAPIWGSGWLARWYRNITAGLLPARLSREFGFQFGRREEIAFQRSICRIRRTLKHLPSSLRYLPAYRSAQRRLSRSH